MQYETYFSFILKLNENIRLCPDLSQLLEKTALVYLGTCLGIFLLGLGGRAPFHDIVSAHKIIIVLDPD